MRMQAMVERDRRVRRHSRKYVADGPAIPHYRVP